MHVILSNISRRSSAGDGDGVRRVVVRAGQVVKVGSTEWADVCVRGDDAMADEHFMVDCTDGSCHLTPLGGSLTQINGEPIDGPVEAGHGDRIQAGRSEFLIEFPHGAIKTESSSEELADEAPAPREIVWPNLQSQAIDSVTQTVGLSDDSLLAAANNPPPEELFATLVEQDLLPDAMQLMAHLLPKRSAVWWGLQSIAKSENNDGDADESNSGAPVDIIRQWCEEPTEANRQACGALALQLAADRPESSLAWAAFYSGGSMIPGEDSIEAPPSPAMTGHAVTAALTTAACLDNDMLGAMRRFLEAAVVIAQGDVPWDILEEQSASP